MLLTILFHVLMGVMPPCASDDGTNCAWNAATQGNGSGTSFVDVAGITWYPGSADTATESEK